MKTNKLCRVYPIVIAIFAAAACCARLWELRCGFEPQGWTAEHPSVAVMRAAAIAVCALAALGALAAKPSDFDFAGGVCGAGKIPTVAAAFLLVAAGLVGAATGASSPIRLVLAAFAAVAGVALILAVKARGGAAAVLPVFFVCYLLLALYVEHSGDLSRERYGYGILAAVAGCAVFYCAASSAFGVWTARFKLAAGGVASPLSAVAAATALVERDFAMFLIFAAVLVFSYGLVLAVCSQKRAIPAKPEPKEQSAGSESVEDFDPLIDGLVSSPSEPDGEADGEPSEQSDEQDGESN